MHRPRHRHGFWLGARCALGVLGMLQPLHNLGGDAPVRSWALSSVVAVARRRLAQRPLALEVFLIVRPAARASVCPATPPRQCLIPGALDVIV